ncbi:MAG: rhomboid family intramembrane serine protease [Candidatus Acidiferrales bacterium]
MELSPRLRWRIDQIRKKLSATFGGRKEPPRPKLCPACGTLVGATATRCHQCGASLTFSLAAASKSLEQLMPATSPATYGILTLSCIVYAVTLALTVRRSGFAPPGGGLFGLGNFGGIGGDVLQVVGASLPWPVDRWQPWRLVTAVFMHGSLLHILFNMWVLMDIGPQIEELYGSARYLFVYVTAGVGGFVLSSALWHFSVGGSGAILGLCGVVLAVTMGARSGPAQMLRSSVIRLLIYVAIIGFLPLGGFIGAVDNSAHLAGLATGFALGKIMADRPPATIEERKRAYILGWGTALMVVASFGMAIFGILQGI